MMRAEEDRVPPGRLLVMLWAGLWIAYGAWTWRAGVRAGVDTGMFSQWGDLLIAHRFNLWSFLQAQHEMYIPPSLYLGWIVLVAGAKSLLGASWMQSIVFLNWLWFGAGAYGVLTAVRRTTASAAGLVLAAGLFLAAGDLLIFIPFVLSDLIFWGMASVTLVAGVRLATAAPDDDGLVRIALLGSLLVLIAFVFRPAGLPLLAYWIVALATAFARGPFDRFATAIVATAAVLSLAAIAWHAAIVTDAAAWPFARLPEILAVQAKQYRAGVLVFMTPETHLAAEPAVTWLGAMRFTAQKMSYFLTPWLPSYSLAHALINLAFFLPAYGLTMAAVMNRGRLGPPQRRAMLILLLFVFSVVVFHVLLPLDYDHRYRLPILPALIMLAAIGFESLRRPAPQDAVDAPRGLV
jgi:hypothetical protein